jgi:hypothetical protein
MAGALAQTFGCIMNNQFPLGPLLLHHAINGGEFCMLDDVPVPCFDSTGTVRTMETAAGLGGGGSAAICLDIATRAGRDACSAARCLMQQLGMVNPSAPQAAPRLAIAVHDVNAMLMESMIPETMPLAGVSGMQVFNQHSLVSRLNNINISDYLLTQGK